MPKVSIIIPIYNVSAYLPRTVGSVLAQTERDIEILLVDDGSTDNSGEVCDAFAAQDARVRVIHKENGGLSSARNAGTAEAQSSYVLFLDGDDYLRADAIERLLSVMCEYPCDFVQFRYQEVEEGAEPVVTAPTEPVFQAHTSGELFEQLYRLGGVAASGATKLMRRELALEIPFADVRHEDELWCTHAFAQDRTVTYIPDELYYYVMRDNSIIRSGFKPRKPDTFAVSEARIDTLQTLGLDEFVGQEYNRLFHSILQLYPQAKLVKDAIALEMIEQEFEKEKDAIARCAGLTGKFRLLFRAMCISFRAIDLYALYRRLR